jgi:hypothetical protein
MNDKAPRGERLTSPKWEARFYVCKSSQTKAKNELKQERIEWQDKIGMKDLLVLTR